MAFNMMTFRIMPISIMAASKVTAIIWYDILLNVVGLNVVAPFFPSIID